MKQHGVALLLAAALLLALAMGGCVAATLAGNDAREATRPAVTP